MRHTKASVNSTDTSHFSAPKRRFGQNYLVDLEAISRIISAARVTKKDHVLEIGPGRGALTEKIVDLAEAVTAVEIDRDLQRLLLDRFAATGSFTLIRDDILSVDLASIKANKVIGNLPYNISSPILTRLIGSRFRFERLVLMFQREVVDRITARPGTSDHGYMSVIAQSAFEIERVLDLPPSSFLPSPKVWSSVVSLSPKPASVFDEDDFRQFLSTAFAKKRKTLSNNLKGKYSDLSMVTVDLSRRAETLTLDEWPILYSQIAQK